MVATRLGTVSASCSTSLSTPVSTCTAVLKKHVHDSEELCRYPSKKCCNLRVLKRNGERHNLCEFHRQKANKNQRRLEFKRKARAQVFADAKTPTLRLRVNKKQRQHTRRAPLCAHLAMTEEVRAKTKAEKMGKASVAVSPGLTNYFLQDLVLLDSVYDQTGFQVKGEQLDASLVHTIKSDPTQYKTVENEALRLPDAVSDEVLDRILADEQAEPAAVCNSLHMASRVEAIILLPEGKTSPVDVGESWDTLDFSDYWLTPSPADQSAISSDAQLFAVDESVLVADV